MTKRGADPDRHLNFDIYVIEPKAGAQERQLTTFTGSDLDPYWETRPAWSPDSTRIAYLRSGEDKWIYYAPWQLAIVDVATGSRAHAGADRPLLHQAALGAGRPERLRAGRAQPRHPPVADRPRRRRGDAADARATRFDYDLRCRAQRPHRRARRRRPAPVRDLGGRSRRACARWPTTTSSSPTSTLAPVEPIRFTAATAPNSKACWSSRSATRRASAIRRSCACMAGRCTSSATSSWPTGRRTRRRAMRWSRVNPRGSSGRGFDFAKAIYADWGNVDVAGRAGRRRPRRRDGRRRSRPARASAAGATAAS